MSAKTLEMLRQAMWASLEAAERVNSLVWLPPFNAVGIAEDKNNLNSRPQINEGGDGTKGWMNAGESWNCDQNLPEEVTPEPSSPYVTFP